MIPLNYLIVWLALLLPAATAVQAPTADLEAAIEANFQELNAVRKHPARYAALYQVPALRKVPAKPALVWDEQLAALAQRKAEDMASKNYMAHVDKKGRGMNYYLWQAGYLLPEFYSKDSRANNVESIAANTEGPADFVKQLIIDEGVPNLGHRKHLLGFNDGDTPATHVGIGIAYNPNSKYKYYCSILIAPKLENQ
jgi:uncharacterized protein YkwD